MHLRVAHASPDGANRLVYVCHGFDGEGCDHVAGQAEAIEWTR